MIRRRVGHAVDAHPVASFFALAYAFSWVAWLPVVLGATGPLRTVSYVVGGFGPALAGAVITWLDGESVREWARQVVRWRVAPRWYLVAVALPLLVVALASVGMALWGTEVDPGLLSGRLSLVVASYLTVALVGGGNEEPGWRGFALPRLQNRYAPVPATLILGVVWAFWHLPQLAADPSAVYGLAWVGDQLPRIALAVVNIVGFAFLLTWVYNETESVLLVLLLHAGVNTANSTLVPLPVEAITGESFTTVVVAVDVAVWVVALGLILATRGRLGLRDDAGAPRGTGRPERAGVR